MLKKFFLSLFAISLIFFCGFKKADKPYLILSAGTINEINIQRIERAFSTGQRINYALVTPKGLKYSGVRLQVSSQNEKTSNWGFSLVETRDIYIPTYSTIYRDYFVARKSGKYILQFFYLNKKNHPFAHIEFWVK